MSLSTLCQEYYRRQLEVVTKGMYMVHEEFEKLLSLTSDAPQARPNQRESGFNR